MKKIMKIMLLIMAAFIITACGGEKAKPTSDKTDSMSENTTTKIIEQNEDGFILKGEVEGYTFTVTDEQTDRVLIQMESGDSMLVVLSNKDAPKTIANFKKLVDSRFYDDIVFHRIYKGFMIQGGDPTGTGSGGSSKTIKGEFSSNGVENKLSHTRGVISMARSSEPNSASSQFFIMHDDNTSLDGNYAAFGKLFAGYNTLDKIANVEVVDNGDGEVSKPVKPPVIKTIRFITVEKAEKAE